MNDTINMLLEHRTIREFTDETLSKGVLNTLSKVAMRTATSSGMQACSIIRVTDKKLKQEIAEICNQEYVARLPEFWLFIVDNYRNSKIAEEMNSEEQGSGNMKNFFQAYIDAAITAQTVEIAAESIGLGAVYFGSIYNNIGRLIEMFKLPKFTFPVVGLGFGYPSEKPQLKPRMKKELRIFENSYQEFSNYLDEIKEYDKEMTTYYDLRNSNKRSDSFSNTVSKRLAKTNELNIIKKIEEQGFEIENETSH